MRLIKRVYWNLFRLKLVLPVLFGTFLLLPSHGQTGDTTLLYPVKSIQSDPYTQEKSSSVDLKDPKNFKQVTEYDPETGNYIIRNMVGDVEVGSPTLMSYDEYLNYDMQRSLNEFWKNRRLEEEGRKEGGPLDINISLGKASAIFGEGGIKLKPQGYAELQFGVKTNKIDNPALSEDLRKTTIFDFDEKIVLSVAGSVGDRIKMNMDYNTEATFDFDNTINLNYEGKEDDIVKKVEAGNVSLPLSGSLIRGSQSLFGVKTELQFGKLSVAAVFSQQESETETMTLKGGATSSDFEISADEYDANRNFFLTHFFEKNYDKWMKNIPVVTSGVVINRIEVWVTNKRGDYDDSRNIVAFMDLAEPESEDIYNSNWSPSTSGVSSRYIAPANKFNTLYSEISSTYSGFRNISGISTAFNGVMKGGVDYEKVENARPLSSNEYTLNKNLGYISLNTALNSDEVLAVAFEYQYQGKVYQVGEFSTDSIQSPQALAVKLLKGTNLSPQLKTWDLMMKNIYSLDARQVDQDDFMLEVMYHSDSLGTDINYIPEPGLRDERLLNLMKLDRLNSQNEQGSDGFFDWVSGLTIIPDRGKIIFPVTKPFSSEYLSTFMSPSLAEKYAYDSLYTQTLTVATQNAEKNKFLLEGSYKAASGSEIKLNAFNIPRGSVVVTAGGRTLTENVDYTIDYASGYIKILNQSLLDAGTTIQVSMENSATFSLQKKTMIGTHLDYRFSDDFTLGGTIMHLYERPLTQKVSIGEDPISNTIWGLNGAYKTEMPFLTKLIDKLPLIETKAPSSMTVNGEFAQLIPGHAKVIGDGGSVYLDDFEATKIGIDIKHYFSWKLSSTPTEIIEATNPITNLDYGKHRARIAWYTIDRLFQNESSSLMPSHIKNDPEMRSNHYSRAVSETNLFPNVDNAYGESTLISVLNVAYYPEEKGPYNFSLDLNSLSGKMNNPEQNWGGVMRRMETTDFEQANIEYIEFWVMDPFIYDDSENRAGKLIFNLGEISEDILKDGRKSFEHGLPSTSDITGLVDTTSWGRVPVKQSLTQAFANTETSRIYQDIGLDGLNDDDEATFFNDYIDQLTNVVTKGANTYIDSLFNDPSQDDYHYYRGSDYDADKTSILDRYKLYNNVQGNSPTDAQSNESYSTTGSNLPDAEDINQDNTLSENENYYRYVVDLDPAQMKIGGQKYITDVKTEHVKLANGNEDSVKWYQFRVPISDYDNIIGSISGFKSIRFMRMFLEDFKEPVILRFASLELVRGEWRKYTVALDETGENNYRDAGVIDIGSVNIEENSDRTPVNYVLPPGVDRVIDPGQPQLRELNEQSMTLKVLNLAPQDARAVYKTMQMDMRQYKRLQMWVHAEELVNVPGVNTDLEDDDLSIFIRLGSDFKNNYYEYEIPLKLTPARVYNNDNTDHREIVWPEDNRFDIPFELFTDFKLKRNREANASGDVKISLRKGEPVTDNPTHWIYIKGNPSLSDVRTIMIGVRNKRRQTTEYRSGEVWVNELRLSEFDEDGGWAAIGSMSLKLADLGTVNMSGSISTAGFGGLEQNLLERQMDDLSSYDISTNLQLGKFFPKKAQVSLPLNYTFSKDVVSPKYNPLDEDVLLQDAIDNAETQAEKDSIKNMSLEITTRKSISLPNVRIGYGGEKKQFFDPNNVSMNFTYNETEHTSPTVQRDLSKTFRGGLQYSYSPSAKPVEPFKKLKFLESDHLALIRDFNFYYLPTQFSFRTDMDRDYNELLYRDISNTGIELPLSVSKDWYWNRQIDIKYKLANSLQLSLSSQSNALIGEPEGYDANDNPLSLNRNTQRAYYEAWQDSVIRSIREWGRSVLYHQVFSANYSAPFSKIPLLDWITADGTYNATYDWERGANSLKATYDEDGNSLFLGHTIENARNININTTLNFTGLYSKWKFLDDANKKYGRAGSSRSSGAKKMVTAKYEHNFDFPEGQKVVIEHKLGSKTPNVRIYDANNKQVTGKRNIVDENTIEFTSSKAVEGARVVITARVEEKSNPAIEMLQRTARVLMGVKNVSANYTRNNSLIIPGFDGEPNIIGQDNIGGMPAPGYAFAFGSQSLNIIDKANQNGWLINNQLMTDPYISQQVEQFRGQASIEPINGLRITLNTNWAQNQVLYAYYYYDTESNNNFVSNSNPSTTGNFSMSWISIRTAFKKIQDDENYSYEPFNEFVSNNRTIIAQRTGNSDLNSQEVLIPAFLAGYSGIDAHTIKLHSNAMPDIFSQLPNWNIRYDGLSKIPLLQKYFKNVTLNHSYTATYNISGFTTNLSTGELEIPSVNITEALNPLINVDMAFKNSLTSSLEMSKTRNIMLNISNNQVVETVSNDFSIGLGYRWDNFDLVINSGGRSKNVSNDLNLRADFTLRDMKTIIRKIEENYNQPSTGQNAININLTADYTLSKSVTIRLYYNRQAINPLVSTSFSTATSDFGVSFKFQLIQ